MDEKKKLAQRILREVEAKQRAVVSPGNLQAVEITLGEAETLGLVEKGQQWNTPRIQLSKLKELAGIA